MPVESPILEPAASLRDPAGFHGDDGILATPFPWGWVAVAVALGASTRLAARAVRRPSAVSR
jgi:hypothetical protein